MDDRTQREVTPLPGWYKDPEFNGEERWWDGTEWTDQRRRGSDLPPPPLARRRPTSAPTQYQPAAPRGVIGGSSPALDAAIFQWTAQGYVVQHNTGQQAVLTKKADVNHVAYFLLGIFTCGIVWVVWLIAVLVANDRRLVLTVTGNGQVVVG